MVYKLLQFQPQYSAKRPIVIIRLIKLSRVIGFEIIKQNMQPQSITWVPRSKGANAEFAVRAGFDSGRDVFVARANHLGGVVPGKLHIGYPCAFIPYGFHEHAKQEYEVLVAPPGTTSWVKVDDRKIPQHAIQGGNDPNGDPYYIARVGHQGTLTCGKVHSGAVRNTFTGHTRSWYEMHKEDTKDPRMHNVKIACLNRANCT